jgi:hypothetical protein
VRLRVEVDHEPLTVGAAVAGRVVVEDGGRARSLSVRLAFVERTEDLHTVARVAGEQTVAEGELVAGAVVPFLLTLPADARPAVTIAHSRIGWELRARADRPGPDAIADHPVELQRGYTAEDRERWPSG